MGFVMGSVTVWVVLVSPQKLVSRAAAEAAGLLLRTAENLGTCLSLIHLFSMFSLEEFSTGAALYV